MYSNMKWHLEHFQKDRLQCREQEEVHLQNTKGQQGLTTVGSRWIRKCRLHYICRHWLLSHLLVCKDVKIGVSGSSRSSIYHPSSSMPFNPSLNASQTSLSVIWKKNIGKDCIFFVDKYWDPNAQVMSPWLNEIEHKMSVWFTTVEQLLHLQS